MVLTASGAGLLDPARPLRPVEALAAAPYCRRWSARSAARVEIPAALAAVPLPTWLPRVLILVTYRRLPTRFFRSAGAL